MTAQKPQRLRNIAIVAHVDHGKTTLVDRLLQQSGSLGRRDTAAERVMDSGDLERERGITILSKNTAIVWRDWRINLVDTPGHADFGGEVERILSMVDSVALLVDAVDGPMPQTAFITRKVLARGFRPILVINKLDRPGARPDQVLEKSFDLFDSLGADESQLDFPVVYASATEGWAGAHPDDRAGDMTHLLQTIVDHVPPPQADPHGPLQMQISALDYSSFVGVIGIGRVRRGRIRRNMPVTVVPPDGPARPGRLMQILGFAGLERQERETAEAGDIVAIAGIGGLGLSDTLCDPARPEALPALTVDEPTIAMTFQVNDSPFGGQEGQFVTSRVLGDRLQRELMRDVALRVSPTGESGRFRVAGRGELHLSILVETMRREGYELALSRPEVILREIDGKLQEPWEILTVDIETVHQGAVMARLGTRRGALQDMQSHSQDRVRLDYRIPGRGLIGFRGEFLPLTSGSGLMYHRFDRYAPRVPGRIGQRHNGALISSGTGKALAHALFNLQERGQLFIGPGTAVYEGMVIGICNRPQDLTVNPLRAKQLTNIRAAGSDENIVLTPPVPTSLDQALPFINDDELVEVTPRSIRIRKKHLQENRRRKHARTG